MIYENIVDDILSNKILPKKMEKYEYSIHNLHNTNVVEDGEYQKKYKNFFALRRLVTEKDKDIKAEKFKKYFEILEKFKNEKIDIDTAKQIYDECCEINGRRELSFATKIMHVIDNDFPIYDSVVGGDHFGFYMYQNTDAWAMYLEYKTNFEDYVKKSEDAMKMIEIFDKKFPQYKDVKYGGFSDIKKVDFVLWQDKKKDEKKPKVKIPEKDKKKDEEKTKVKIPEKYKK